MITEALSHDEIAKEKERIASLYSYDILDTDYEEAYNDIVEIASYICGTPVSLISLLDNERQWFKARKGFEMTQTSRSVSFCHHAIKQDDLMEISDTHMDERFADNLLVTGNPNIRFYAGSPLIMSDGQKLGTLCVIDKKPKILTQEQKKSLKTLSQQVVAQMELRKQKKELLNKNHGLVIELENKIEEQTKVLQLFSRFVPQDTVSKHLSSDKDLVDDAELKYVVVLFCDIRGYTSIVENLAPKLAVKILQTYYSLMSDIINKYSGIVNQYVGDEIFAIFGLPFTNGSLEKQAVLCSIEMIECLKKLNEECARFTNQEIKIGIGLHSGEVIAGTLGSRNKIEYSVTGDVVNTGKRIESLTQTRPNKILISENVYNKVKDIIEVEHWEPMSVKGKVKPLDIFEVRGKNPRFCNH